MSKKVSKLMKKMINQMIKSQYSVIDNDSIYNCVEECFTTPHEIQLEISEMYDIDSNAASLIVFEWLYKKGFDNILERWYFNTTISTTTNTFIGYNGTLSGYNNIIIGNNNTITTSTTSFSCSGGTSLSYLDDANTFTYVSPTGLVTVTNGNGQIISAGVDCY